MNPAKFHFGMPTQSKDFATGDFPTPANSIHPTPTTMSATLAEHRPIWMRIGKRRFGGG